MRRMSGRSRAGGWRGESLFLGNRQSDLRKRGVKPQTLGAVSQIRGFVLQTKGEGSQEHSCDCTTDGGGASQKNRGLVSKDQWKKKKISAAQLLISTVNDSPDSSHCMTKARQDQLGPQVLDALELPCPSGVQPSGGQLLEQEPCQSECVSPLLVLAAHLRRLVQHTLKGQAVRSLPCKQGENGDFM